MILRSLGGLSLSESSFRRAKPLLLLLYLRLEGTKPRRYVAEIFWPGAQNALSSLSVALSQLRQGAAGAVEADDVQVWTNISCDALMLREALAAGDFEAAAALYGGAFLEGFDLPLGEELEEWLYNTREGLAAAMRECMLQRAEAEAAAGGFESAARRAETAYTLAGAPELEPEALLRVYTLLAAGSSPLAAQVRDEAAAFGASLSVSPSEARRRLRRTLLGREGLLERLGKLEPGEWAWLRGAPGMGKTSLLKSLPGTYLPGRAGLPYASLEPLLAEGLGESETALLRRLAQTQGVWLLDNWERMDSESQALLTKLRALRPDLQLIITAQGMPPFDVDLTLEVAPLPEAALRPYSGLWEASGGLPGLVGAFLRGERLEAALERKLAALSLAAQDVYLSLCLLERPDPALVRRALGLDAPVMAAALEEALAAGLVQPSGQVRAREAARELLEAHPARLGGLALCLARLLEGTAAFELFERARSLWEDADMEAVQSAYLAWAQELLRRGFPNQAHTVLERAPAGDAVTLLRARALERAARYKEALEALTLTDTPEVLALRASLYWRLGRRAEAQAAATEALDSDGRARAEALQTLGFLAFSAGDTAQAEAQFRRAATLWRTLAEPARWADALNNVAAARSEQGEDTEAAFQEAFEAAGANAPVKARVMLNLGLVRERRGETERAEASYLEAITLADSAGDVGTAARIFNNLGALYHRQERVHEAQGAYERALELAREGGESLLLGTILANLAELTSDIASLEEALYLFKRAGHQIMIERYQADLAALRAR